MILKTKVKVGNITSLSDARYCAGMGVDLLGFPVVDSKGAELTPEKLGEITGWVSGPLVTLEVDGSNDHDISRLIELFHPEVIQVNLAQLAMLEEPVECQLIVSLSPREWVSAQTLLQRYKNSISYLLIVGNEQDIVSKTFIQEAGQQFQLLLGFGVTKSSLPDILKLPLTGVALLGSEESKTGYKSYDQLADVLEMLEVTT